MSKLLEDPKVAALVERMEKRAVNAYKRAILAGLKELKEDYGTSENVVVKRTASKVIVAANKIVRNPEEMAEAA